MLRFSLTLLLLWLTSPINWAQTRSTSLATGSDVYWNLPTVPGPAQAVLTLSQTTIPEPTSRQNEIRLDQQGGGSRAMLSVVNGLQNRVELVQQNGSGAYATVSGSNNSLIVTQTGGGNQLGLGLTGHGNRLSISQDGGRPGRVAGLSTRQQPTRTGTEKWQQHLHYRQHDPVQRSAHDGYPEPED